MENIVRIDPEDDALMRTGTPDGMAQIPGGTFRMGSDVHYPEERPAHSVTRWLLDRPPRRHQCRLHRVHRRDRLCDVC